MFLSNIYKKKTHCKFQRHICNRRRVSQIARKKNRRGDGKLRERENRTHKFTLNSSAMLRFRILPFNKKNTQETRPENHKIFNFSRVFSSLHQQHGIDTSVVLRMIGDLRVFAPNHFSSLSNESQFGDIDFDDGSFRDHS